LESAEEAWRLRAQLAGFEGCGGHFCALNLVLASGKRANR